LDRIDTKVARALLPPRREPYWYKLGKGFYVGFRRTETGSETWVARHWLCGCYRFAALNLATDFDVAKELAQEWRKRLLGGVTERVPSVSEVCRTYVESMRTTRPATASDSEGRFSRLIFNAPIGGLRLDRLFAADIRKWLADQIPVATEGEFLRKAKVSANRNLASLKAALTMAFNDRHVADTHAWSSVKPFSGVSAGRGNEAFVERSLRLAYIKNSPTSLACLIKACLYTGARPGELQSLEARDYNRVLKTLTFRRSKQQRPREIALTDDAATFFDELSGGVIGGGLLLRCEDGTAWNKDKWKAALSDLCSTHMLPHLRLYDLRHTAISEMLMAGVDSFAVAKHTGTSVQMIERTYGHLKLDGLREAMGRVAFV
jgi:integrase